MAHPTPLPAAVCAFLRDEALRRFLSYVAIETTSADDAATQPSTPGQLVLGDLLAAELRALGAADVERDERGYVYAHLPASPGASGPAVGFLAHLDTSSAAPGGGVKPLLRRSYDGGVLGFPDDPLLTLSPQECPELLHFKGEDLVTASGTTLLGADDKAGVAEVMAALAAFRKEPSLRHPEIRVCFTPDEEIGAGTAGIRLERLGKLAYTLDAGMVGELETECFDARRARVCFRGLSVHPGYSKNLMVNAGAIAARFFASLPEAEAPEHTAGREGFFHLDRIAGAEGEAELHLILRDFEAAGNDRRIGLLERTRAFFEARHPGLRIEIEIKEQYRNMKEVLDRHPEAAEAAREAIEAVGVPVIRRAIRGGTDGARLCFLGVPTPNLFAGGILFHSRKEWIPVSALGKAAEVLLQIGALWYDRPLAGGGSAA